MREAEKKQANTRRTTMFCEWNQIPEACRQIEAKGDMPTLTVEEGGYRVEGLTPKLFVTRYYRLLEEGKAESADRVKARILKAGKLAYSLNLAKNDPESFFHWKTAEEYFAALPALY
jgi:hypothetical protein